MASSRFPSDPDWSSRTFLTTLFRAAVDAADAARCVPPFIPDPPAGRVVVVGAGKAAAAMARAVETSWDSVADLTGLVITRYGHSVPCERIEVIEAGHPIPDTAGERAARRILDLVQGLREEDLALCLLSGGGSALLAVPTAGINLQDKREITQALLRSGATIAEINCVRKHLSAVKGGQLAAAAFPAPTVTLAISDVPGDDPSVIASGPTVADPTTFADARAVLAKYGIEPPVAVAAHLAAARQETPKPGDPRLAQSAVRIVANARRALEAAATTAREEGIAVEVLGDSLEGEARDLANQHASIATNILRRESSPRPMVLLSGGEATVSVRGSGRGGPNSEYLLALALALDGAPGVYALAADTDGIDGTEDNAGARIGPDTLARAAGLGLDAARSLADNDAYGFFAGLGDLVITGPTLTNVNDFRAILITP